MDIVCLAQPAKSGVELVLTSSVVVFNLVKYKDHALVILSEEIQELVFHAAPVQCQQLMVGVVRQLLAILAVTLEHIWQLEVHVSLVQPTRFKALMALVVNQSGAHQTRYQKVTEVAYPAALTPGFKVQLDAVQQMPANQTRLSPSMEDAGLAQTVTRQC